MTVYTGWQQGFHWTEQDTVKFPQRMTHKRVKLKLKKDPNLNVWEDHFTKIALNS